MSLPLEGCRVLELAGLAPGPFAGMILADFGADVVRIERAVNKRVVRTVSALNRGKRSIALDLKRPEGISALKKLVETADVLIEPFRPGVMERLGCGPDVMCAANPRLIYARLTGFGQGGLPQWRDAAGHDINYLALSGVLSTFKRRDDRPMFPANVVGDFGGGGMLCVMGILLALLERGKSGKGQVIDAAMVDGSAYLSTFIINLQRSLFRNPPGNNSLDSGAHYYNTYETKDGKYFTVGAVEASFYKELLKGMGLSDADLPRQNDDEKWPAMEEKFKKIFKSKTRDEWTAIFEGKDACAFPVLSLEEASKHPHNVARKTFIPALDGGLAEPAPAPKLSRTPGVMAVRPEPYCGQHTAEVLEEYGIPRAEVESIIASGGAAQAQPPKTRRKAKL